MEHVILNSGIGMPLIGYGTYQTPPGITERCVSDALEAGYRSIDTAQCYGNEREVGLACRRSGIPRDEIFITTKLWACRGYSDTMASIDRSLRELNTDHIDLLLIHEPTGDVRSIYRAMEKRYREGELRAIGISNFMEDRYIDLLEGCDVVPAVNQVETHVFRQQQELRRLESENGTQHESWSPLACGRNGIFGNGMLGDIVRHHGTTVSQVALRFLVQQGIVVIPKSTKPEHMAENLSVTDFELEPGEMESLKRLDEGRSLFGWW